MSTNIDIKVGRRVRMLYICKKKIGDKIKHTIDDSLQYKNVNIANFVLALPLKSISPMKYVTFKCYAHVRLDF